MSIVFEERLSDSPYVETVTHGYTVSAGTTTRPSEIHWHMVFVKLGSGVIPIVVGPLTSSGIVTFGEGAEMLWVKFRLGTFMPHMPLRNFLDHETALPEASCQSFWLNGSTWQLPNYENVDTFVDWLVREDVLVRDPLIDSVLQGHPQEMSPRTVRHRFLRTTGLSQNHIFQYYRAQQAVEQLQQGIPILDVAYDLGYFDQPHLTRSLKRFMGTTPAQAKATLQGIE